MRGDLEGAARPVIEGELRRQGVPTDTAGRLRSSEQILATLPGVRLLLCIIALTPLPTGLPMSCPDRIAVSVRS